MAKDETVTFVPEETSMMFFKGERCDVTRGVEITVPAHFYEIYRTHHEIMRARRKALRAQAHRTIREG